MAPNRVHWDPGFTVGRPAIDEQHRHLLEQCNALADLCAVDGGNAPADASFKATYEQLMAVARAHFAAEEALLIAGVHPELDDYRCEIEEYEFLAAEIATTENFDKIELQRFLALWWLGHILGDAKRARGETEPS